MMRSKYEWDHYNNIARNNAMLKELELWQAKEDLFPAARSTCPTYHETPPRQTPTHQTPYETPPSQTPLHETPPSQMPPTLEAQQSAVVLWSDLPKWMTVVLPLLDQDLDARGDTWKWLVETWI